MQRTRISCSSEELPGTPGKAKSCTLLAEEFGNLCPRSRGSQSLEPSSFLGTETSLVFLVVLDVTASPVYGTVSCLRDVITPPSCRESPCPQCKFCFHIDPRRLLSPHSGFFFPHTNFFDEKRKWCCLVQELQPVLVFVGKFI